MCARASGGLRVSWFGHVWNECVGLREYPKP